MHTPFMDKASHHRTGVGAAGRLKQRLAQLLVRSSCTTNTTKTTTTSAPTFVSLDKATANPRQEPRHSPDWCTYQRPKLEEGSRSRRRSASVVHTSTDCAGTASGHRSFRSEAPLLSSSLPMNNAKGQSKQSRGKPGSQSVPRRQRSCSSRGRGRRPRRTSTMYSYSSSTVTDDESGEEAETRTLFSSLSFSSDSTSEFYHTNSSTASRKSQKNAPRRAPRRPSVAANHHERNTRKKEQDLIKKVDAEAEEIGSIGAGMAVVKRSSNPYADFRSSMVEMVVERQIASVGKMEELLGSYLSLNSPEHHPAILAAFEDVWEAVFGQA